MLYRIDRFMVSVGYKARDVKALRRRHILYAANIGMFALACFMAGMAANAWLFA